MADAVVANPGTTADVVVRLVRAAGTADIPNNRTWLTADLYLVVVAANGSGGPVDLNQWSTAYIDSSVGLMGNWQGTYDLRPASSLPSRHLIHYEGWIPHLPDGTRTVTFTFGFSGQGGTPLGVGSGTDSITLPRIPRNRARVGDDDQWKHAEVFAGINGEWRMVQPSVGVDGVWKRVDAS